MKLTEQLEEIARQVANRMDDEMGLGRCTSDEWPVEFAARFLAALPKPEPVAELTEIGINWLYDGLYLPVGTKLYTTPPQPDDVRDAERYRWLRDSENQVTEDDPCVSDSFFNSWFGEELDKVIDEMIARNAAIAAAKGEV